MRVKMDATIRARAHPPRAFSPYTIDGPKQILNGPKLKKGKPSPKPADSPVDPLLPASNVRRAKIICTVGPACNSEAMLRSYAPRHGCGPAEFFSRDARRTRSHYRALAPRG